MTMRTATLLVVKASRGSVILLGCSSDRYRTSTHGREMSALVDWELRAVTDGAAWEQPVVNPQGHRSGRPVLGRAR